MYSFKQLFNIFTETNNKSEVQDRVTKNEQDIQTLFKNIEELRLQDQKNREHADKEFADVRTEIRDNKTEQFEINDNHSTRIDTNLASINQHHEILGKIHSEIKVIKNFQEGLQQAIYKNMNRIDNLKTDLMANISSVKEDFKERLGDLDKYYGESMEDMNNNIEAVKIMARDSVNAKEKELTE